MTGVQTCALPISPESRTVDRADQRLEQEQPKSDEVITVNRWQDLQQQLGSRNQPNDYSFPAVLRYQRGDQEDN